MKLTMNQIVYLKPINDNARYIDDDIMNHIEKWEVVKIGRKYFTVRKYNQSNLDIKFYIDDRKQFADVSCDWELYFSTQEILDEKESESLTRKLKRDFGAYGKWNLTLEQLKRIQKIVDEPKEEI